MAFLVIPVGLARPAVGITTAAAENRLKRSKENIAAPVSNAEVRDAGVTNTGVGSGRNATSVASSSLLEQLPCAKRISPVDPSSQGQWLEMQFVFSMLSAARSVSWRCHSGLSAPIPAQRRPAACSADCSLSVKEVACGAT